MFNVLCRSHDTKKKKLIGSFGPDARVWPAHSNSMSVSRAWCGPRLREGWQWLLCYLCTLYVFCQYIAIAHLVFLLLMGTHVLQSLQLQHCAATMTLTTPHAWGFNVPSAPSELISRMGYAVLAYVIRNSDTIDVLLCISYHSLCSYNGSTMVHHWTWKLFLIPRQRHEAALPSTYFSGIWTVSRGRFLRFLSLSIFTVLDWDWHLRWYFHKFLFADASRISVIILHIWVYAAVPSPVLKEYIVGNTF